MSILTAKFKIEMQSYLIIESREEENLEISFDLEGFDIHILIAKLPHGPKSGFTNSDIFRFLSQEILILVSKEESETPAIPLDENGYHNYAIIQPYFDEKLNSYKAIAIKIYKRLISYFKYELHQPLLDLDYLDQNGFSNPEWYDDHGRNYGSVSVIIHIQNIPGWHRCKLGIEHFGANKFENLLNALQCETNIELHFQILSDAQDAILNNNFRRAVLELAIACELSVKRKYFSAGSIAGLAFEYLEDKGKVKSSVIDYISTVAKEVFGESFKNYSETDYNNIDYIFRCRNKVAHRGEVFYKNDSSNIVFPDQKCMKEWYSSTAMLLAWLASK